MVLVHIKIVDVPELPQFGVEASPQDLVASTVFSLRVIDLPNWAPQFGQHIHKWRYYYPTEDTDVTLDHAAFHAAIGSHSNVQPILLKIDMDRGVGDRIPPTAISPYLFNRRGQRLKFCFRIQTVDRTVYVDTPYENDMKFGHFIVGGPRHGCPMDDELINLSNFPWHFRTEFVAILISKVYAYMFSDQHADQGQPHPIRNFARGKTFQSLYRRVGNYNNAVNVCSADTQGGKGQEMALGAVLSLFIGRDSLVFVRNVSGNMSKSTFAFNIKEFGRLVNDFAEIVLEMHLGIVAQLFDSIQVYDGLTRRLLTGNVERPFIYCERFNTSKIEFPFKNIYRPTGRDMYTLWIDEEDEQRQSADATEGGTENLLYNKAITALENDSIAANSHMTTVYTATPCPTLTTKPDTANQDYQFAVIDMQSPPNYKGHNPRLPLERRVVLHCTSRKRVIPKADKEGKTSFEIACQSNPGLGQMLDHMASTWQDDQEYPHVSGLVACSAVSKNVDKEQVASGITEYLAGRPVLAFSHDMNTTLTLHFRPGTLGNVTLQMLEHALQALFDGTNDLVYRKQVQFTSVTLNDCTLEAVFKKKEHKTVQVCYDIARLICELANIQKPFIVCVSFLLANRAVTFKTSNHQLVLTHMYASTKTPTCTYNVDVKQSAGRICSVDDYPFKRHLFATEEYLEFLKKAYAIDMELIQAYSGQGPKTFDEAMLDVSPDSALGYIVHHRSQHKLMKRKQNEQVLPVFQETIDPLENPQAYTLEHDQHFNLALVGPLGPQQQAQFDPQDVPVSTQFRACLRVLYNHGVQDPLTKEEIYELLVQQGNFITHDAGQPIPPHPQWAFVARSWRPHDPAVTDDQRRQQYLARINRALVEASRDHPHCGLIVNSAGNERYFSISAALRNHCQTVFV